MKNKLEKLDLWDNILNIVFIVLLIAVVVLYIKGYEINSAYIVLVFGIINMARSFISKNYSDLCENILDNK